MPNTREERIVITRASVRIGHCRTNFSCALAFGFHFQMEFGHEENKASPSRDRWGSFFCKIARGSFKQRAGEGEDCGVIRFQEAVMDWARMFGFVTVFHCRNSRKFFPDTCDGFQLSCKRDEE